MRPSSPCQRDLCPRNVPARFHKEDAEFPLIRRRAHPPFLLTWLAATCLFLLFLSPPITVLAEEGQDLVVRIKSFAREQPGYQPFGQPEVSDLSETTPLDIKAALSPGRCYWFVGVGGSDEADLVLALDRGGATLARTSEPTATPSLVYCPSSMMSVRARLSCAAHCGPAALGAFSKEIRAASPGGDLKATERLDLLAESLGRIDPLGPNMSGTLAEGKTLDHEATLEAGQCYWTAATGGQGVRDIDLVIFDQETELARSQGEATWPLVFFCPSRDITATIRVVMYAGGGEFALGVYATQTNGSSTVLLAGGAERDFLANRIRQAVMIHASKARPASAPVRQSLAQGQTATLPVHLLRPGCPLVLLAAESSIQGMTATLLSEDGKVLASSEIHSGIAALSPSPCPKSSRDLKVQVTVTSGSGLLALQGFVN